MTGEAQKPQQGVDIDPKLRTEFNNILHYLEEHPHVAEFFTSIIHVMENSHGVPKSSPPLPESRINSLLAGPKEPTSEEPTK